MNSERAGTLLLLGQRRFFPLFAVQFGGALNDNILRNALVAMIAFGSIAQSATPGDKAFLIQIAVALFMLPFLLFSPAAGLFADRCPDRAIAVRGLKLCEIATSCFATAGLAAQSLPLLLTALFLSGVQSACFGPFKYSLLPEILKREELIGGNALLNASTYIAILLGVIFGTQLGVSENAREATSITIICIALLGVLAAWLMLPLPVASSPGWRKALSLNIFSAIFNVVRSASRQHGILQLVLLASWFWGSGALLTIQLPVLVSQVLGYSSDVYLCLLLVVCLGIAVGSMLAALVLKHKVSVRPVAWGIAAASIALLLPVWPADPISAGSELGSLTDFLDSVHAFPVIGMLAAVSVAMGFYIVPIYASMQLWAQEGHRGQMIAANNVFNALFIAGGATAAAAYISTFAHPGPGIAQLFVLLGLCGLCIAGWCFARLGKLEHQVAQAA